MISCVKGWKGAGSTGLSSEAVAPTHLDILPGPKGKVYLTMGRGKDLALLVYEQETWQERPVEAPWVQGAIISNSNALLVPGGGDQVGVVYRKGAGQGAKHGDEFWLAVPAGTSWDRSRIYRAEAGQTCVYWWASGDGQGQFSWVSAVWHRQGGRKRVFLAWRHLHGGVWLGRPIAEGGKAGPVCVTMPDGGVFSVYLDSDGIAATWGRGTSWQSETIWPFQEPDWATVSSNVVLGPGGDFHFLVSSGFPPSLVHVSGRPTAWKRREVASFIGPTWATRKLAIDVKGGLHATWGTPDGGIAYARYIAEDKQWRQETLSLLPVKRKAKARVYCVPSIAVASDMRPHIAFIAAYESGDETRPSFWHAVRQAPLHD